MGKLLLTVVLIWLVDSWAVSAEPDCRFVPEEESVKIMCVNATFNDLRTMMQHVDAALRMKPIIITFELSDIPELTLDTLTIPGVDEPEFHFTHNKIDTLDLNVIKKVSVFKDNTIRTIASASSNNVLYSLRLADNNIQHIDSNTFNKLRVSTIVLSNCGLVVISPNTFSNLHSLDILDLSHNNLTSLPTNAFVNFTKTSYSLVFRTSQTVINLSSNNIADIQVNAFNNIPRIEKIDLSHNNLTILKSGIFNGVKLTFLYLPHNAITHIEPTAFDNLPTLNILDLSDNKLTALTHRMFAKLESLYGINLIGNPITRIEPFSFYNLKSLRREPLGNGGYNIGKFDVHVIQADMFHGLSSISQLDLSSWNLTKIEANAFVGLSQLTHLLLKDNQLTDVVEHTFTGLTDLDYLDLSSNKLKVLRKSMFSGIDSSKFVEELETKTKEQVTTLKQIFFGDMKTEQIYLHIFLKNNIIEKIEPGTFENLINLKQIDLSQNKLTNLEVGVFKGLKYMMKLDLSNNLLETLQKEVLFPMIRLAELDISSNRLKEIDMELVLDHSMTNAMKVVNLNNNEWMCDKLKSMIRDLNYAKVDYVSSSPEHFHTRNVHGIACNSPESLAMSLNEPDSEKTFFALQRELVSITTAQNTWMKLIFSMLLLGMLAMLVMYFARNSHVRTFLHLRSSDRNLHQSTVELLSVPT